MDRSIPQQEQKKRKKQQRMKYSFILIFVCAAFYFFYNFISPSVSKSELRIAIIEKGRVEETIPASGVVVPESEHILTSMITARLKSLKLKAGEKVKEGDAIVILDKEKEENRLASLQDKNDLKKNEIRKQELNFNDQLLERETALSVKELKIRRLETELKNKQRLEAIGGSTKEATERAALALEIAKLEYEQEKSALENFKASKANTLEKLSIESNMLSRELDELGKKIALSDAVATMDGVISWVKDDIGSEVKAGEELARIVNLNSFKVEGSISASYAQALKTGRTVWLRFKDEVLKGRITTIKPAVSKGIVNFDVSLELPSHESLRANRKLDLYVLTDQRENTLRVKNGPVFNGSRYQKIYVLRGDKAFLTELEVGLSNFDYVEIISGVNEGEELIISDPKKFNEVSEIRIK